MNSKLIETGCIPIDRLLNGGIESGTITQIYGESGSGKTNLCLQIAIKFIKNYLFKSETVFNSFIEKIRLNNDIDFNSKIKIAAFEMNIHIEEINKIEFIEVKKRFLSNAQIYSIREYIFKKYNKKVIYIDTEGISSDRFKQIAGSFYKEIAKNILIYEPMSLEEQYVAIKNITCLDHLNIGIVILDSATSYYRYELEDENTNIKNRRELINQISFLHILTRKYNFGTIITNQVFSDVTETNSNTMRAIGGKAIEHISKTILFFEKIGIGKRMATLIKHRSIQEGISCKFQITSNGIE